LTNVEVPIDRFLQVDHRNSKNNKPKNTPRGDKSQKDWNKPWHMKI